ncbi:MAG: hypothetical protein AB1646_19250 [Thermodesulfobacteriota bacterium]
MARETIIRERETSHKPIDGTLVFDDLEGLILAMAREIQNGRHGLTDRPVGRSAPEEQTAPESETTLGNRPIRRK